jgi:crotonobetainyl-CoA:carnitine CoA-transferase CaiB-like acyl-CoA transferase
MTAAGRPEMAADPRLADNSGRVAHQSEVDDAISRWTANLNSNQVLEILERAEVPCGPIYNVADMVEDPHFNARGMFERVSVDGLDLKIPAIVPILNDSPGRTEWAGPEVGAHNAEVLRERLGLGDEDIQILESEGII